ncbi:unnamed protein product [Urochloa humidicola]
MSLICLNCRGCGRSEAVQEIRNIVDLHNPMLLFLSETKMSAVKVQDLRWRLGFPNAFGVNSEGLSGGLGLFWKNNVVIELKNYSKNHIDVWVDDAVNPCPERMWRFTGFYGEPRREKRKESWRRLRFLRHTSTLPWVCAGDFNEIICQSEQFGGNDRGEWQMEGFREAIRSCDLSDLGFNGLPYTWDNRQWGDRNVKVRLDRVLADERLLDRFDGSNVLHVQMASSDHCALLIKLQSARLVGRRHRERPFRYENMWRRHDEYPGVIQRGWG